VLEPSCALTWQVRDAAPAGSGASLPNTACRWR